MIKIKLSKEIENRHLKYFQDNIVPNFYNQRYDSKYSSNKLHRKFMNYCGNKSEVLAIGKPDELENFYLSIPNDIRDDILKLINTDKRYNKILCNIFGYNNFITKNFFDYILEYAKDELNKNSYKKIRYSKEVQDKIIYILKENFPEYKDNIKFQFNKLYNQSQLKKELEKLIVCDITIDKFKQFNIFKESWNPYAFVIMSGIRVCPYCNRQYITPIFSNSGQIRADIDHFLSKSKYPYFSMSLYNLVPSCKFCNSSLKGSKEFDFNDINPYEYSINDYMKFKVNPITNEINIIKSKDYNGKKMTNYIKYFKLETLYNYHQNQAKELIEKRMIYNDDYIEDLFKMNKEILKLKNEKQLRELIIGYIEDESKINDEVFLKLRRDIAEQLHFLDIKQDDKQIEQLKEILFNS